jgi:hypothetical protein
MESERRKNRWPHGVGLAAGGGMMGWGWRIRRERGSVVIWNEARKGSFEAARWPGFLQGGGQGAASASASASGSAASGSAAASAAVATRVMSNNNSC